AASRASRPRSPARPRPSARVTVLVRSASLSEPAVEARPRPRFDGLIHEHQPAVYRFLARLCAGHRQDAEDLCQETFLRAYRAFARLDGEANHRAWLCRIAYNAFLNGRRRARPTALPDDLAAASDGRGGRRALLV